MNHRYLFASIRNLERDQYRQLEELCIFMERTLEREARQREDQGEQEMSGITDEVEQSWIAEGIAEDIFELRRDYPRILRYSLFVTMMGITESSIVQLCRLADRFLNSKRPFSDKGSDIIQRGIKHLTSVGLDLSRLNHYTEFASSLRSIRNAIIHARGRIAGRPDEEKLRTFIKQTTSVDINKRTDIVLNQGFVEASSHEMHMMIARMHEQLQKAMNAQH